MSGEEQRRLRPTQASLLRPTKGSRLSREWPIAPRKLSNSSRRLPGVLLGLCRDSRFHSNTHRGSYGLTRIVHKPEARSPWYQHWLDTAPPASRTSESAFATPNPSVKAEMITIVEAGWQIICGQRLRAEMFQTPELKERARRARRNGQRLSRLHSNNSVPRRRHLRAGTAASRLLKDAASGRARVEQLLIFK